MIKMYKYGRTFLTRVFDQISVYRYISVGGQVVSESGIPRTDLYNGDSNWSMCNVYFTFMYSFIHLVATFCFE